MYVRVVIGRQCDLSIPRMRPGCALEPGPKPLGVTNQVVKTRLVGVLTLGSAATHKQPPIFVDAVIDCDARGLIKYAA